MAVSLRLCRSALDDPRRIGISIFGGAQNARILVTIPAANEFDGPIAISPADQTPDGRPGYAVALLDLPGTLLGGAAFTAPGANPPRRRPHRRLRPRNQIGGLRAGQLFADSFESGRHLRLEPDDSLRPHLDPEFRMERSALPFVD
jgi:hypothetical protein